MPRVATKTFARDLAREVKEDNLSNGAAALAYYLMLSIFPAAIFLLTLLPYLPIAHLDQAIMDLLKQALPGEAASLLTGTVQAVVSQRHGGLLSFGALAAVWAASNGLSAIMKQLNLTYDVKEGRPFWKVRGVALLLTALFGLLVVGAFALVVMGGVIQDWLGSHLGRSGALLFAFAALRWVIICLGLLLAFAVTYYFGPDVEQRFRFVSAGSVFGAAVLVLGSLGFRLYVSRFGNYAATYGSLGAVIILLFWLYLAGWALLIGSEINALLEHYSPGGKAKGEKREPEPARGPGLLRPTRGGA